MNEEPILSYVDKKDNSVILDKFNKRRNNKLNMTSTLNHSIKTFDSKKRPLTPAEPRSHSHKEFSLRLIGTNNEMIQGKK